MERNELIQVRVTPDEKKEIRTLSSNRGMKMSEYVLDCVNTVKGTSPAKTEDDEKIKLVLWEMKARDPEFFRKLCE
jgi:hypothetical protein